MSRGQAFRDVIHAKVLPAPWSVEDDQGVSTTQYGVDLASAHHTPPAHFLIWQPPPRSRLPFPMFSWSSSEPSPGIPPIYKTSSLQYNTFPLFIFSFLLHGIFCQDLLMKTDRETALFFYLTPVPLLLFRCADNYLSR